MSTRFATGSLVLSLSLATALVAAPEERKYTVLMAGNRAGTQGCTTKRAETRCTFTYNDRGRGPSLETTFTVGSYAIPVRIVIAGHNYLKDRVDERFSIEKGTARWKSTVEAGERRVEAPALYLPFDAVPEADAVLVRALRAAKGGSLALLPAGEARLEGSSPLVVSAGGRTKTVTRFDVAGLGLEAQRVFLDEHGELFASGGSWFLTIREGWESAAPVLLASQEAADAEDSARRTRDLARRPKGALVFRGVGLFDADAAAIRPGTTVVVSGNRISDVGPDGIVAIPTGAEIVDGKGKTLLPGLFDMHVHVSSDVDGILDLASGITTVRDLGNDLPEVTSRRDRFESGAAIGPHLLTSVLVDGPGPFAGPTKFLVSTEDEGIAAVDACVKARCAGLKIYSSIKPELVPALVRAAHAKGIRASGHVPAFMTAEQAVRDGYDEIHHVNFLFLNFLFDKVPDTRTPARFKAVVESAASLDLSSPAVRDFTRLLKVRGVVADPTVATFEDLFLSRPGVVPDAWTGIADRLPPQVRRSFLAGGLPVGEGGEARVHASFDALLRMVRLLHDSGVRIVAGTDSFAGFSLPRELELYVKAGIPAAEVLQIATIGAARVAGLADDVGTVVAGKRADLVLVDGNPTERISDVRKVSLVVKNGLVFDPAALLKSIGIRH
ncbi:MAG: amidohydrolase family protein [Thermoanaerobaculia bacterium]|nr:amidohydrolase family protein [Thermoanaerobaculia bacterium]